MSTMLVLKWSISFYSFITHCLCALVPCIDFLIQWAYITYQKISFFSFNKQNSASHPSWVRPSKNVPHISYNRSHIPLFNSSALTSFLIGTCRACKSCFSCIHAPLQIFALDLCSICPNLLYYLQLEQLKPTNIG